MIVLLLFVLGVVWCCAFGACIVAVLINEIDDLYNMFDPIVMCDNSNLNIFGVIMLTIINYILFFLQLFYSGLINFVLGEGDKE